MFPGNGRCIEGGDATSLLFDARGRPSPWFADTHGLTNDDSRPVTILDENSDGRAEIVIHDCEYAMDRMGEERWIDGVFEAREGAWVEIESAMPGNYLRRLDSRNTLLMLTRIVTVVALMAPVVLSQKLFPLTELDEN